MAYAFCPNCNHPFRDFHEAYEACSNCGSGDFMDDHSYFLEFLKNLEARIETLESEHFKE